MSISQTQTQAQPLFQYMLLSRLQSDCEYFLGWGNRNEKDLWAGSIDAQIEEMKSLWNGFPNGAKPVWLSIEQINKYALEMGATV